MVSESAAVPSVTTLKRIGRRLKGDRCLVAAQHGSGNGVTRHQLA